MTIGEQISLKMENKKIKFLKKTRLNEVPAGHFVLDNLFCHIFKVKRDGLKVIHDFSNIIGSPSIYKKGEIIPKMDFNYYYLTPYRHEIKNMIGTIKQLIVQSNLKRKAEQWKKDKLSA